jgi:sulfate permease, SulP family
MTDAIQAAEKEYSPSQLLPSIVAGMLCGIVIIVAGVSQAAFIFTGPLEEYLPVGIGITLFASTVLAVIVAMRSSVPGMIGTTQQVPIASLALIASWLSTSLVGAASSQEIVVTVVAAMGLASVLTGVAFYAMGYFRLGRLIRFIPFPVIAGFLAGTGWLITKGSIGVIAGNPDVLTNFQLLSEGHVLLKFSLAIIFIALISFLSQRTHSSLALSMTVIAATILFHLVAFSLQTPFADLREAGWIIDLLDKPGLWPPFALSDLMLVRWEAIAQQWLSILSLVVLSTMAVLMNSSGLELALHRDIDFDKELRIAGAANLVAGAGGGTAGFQDLGLTLLSHRLGGVYRMVGPIIALLCVLFMTAGAPFLTFVPKPLFGALLLWVGANLILDWLVLTFKRVTAAEYAVIVMILLIIISVGLLPGIIFGLVAGLVLFVVDYSKVDIVKNELTGADFHSNVDRSEERRQFLEKHGQSILVYRLQGFVFFGTADRLREQIMERLNAKEQAKISYLIIDFVRVTGLDTSAVVSFQKLAHFARMRGIALVLTGFNQSSHKAFLRSGLASGEFGRVMIFPDLDRGIEWCEDQLLETIQPDSGEPASYSVAEQLAQVVDDKKLAAKLADYLERVEFEPDAVMIEQASPSEEMYFIESGQATVDLKGDNETHIRLKTLGPGAIAGEIAFYLGGPRTASVIARTKVVAWQFTQKGLLKVQKEAPELAVAFHKGMASMLAGRLSSTNRLVQFLMS